MAKKCIECGRPNYGGGQECGRCLDGAVEKYFGLKEGIVEETFGPPCVYVLVDEVGNCPVWENLCRDCDRCLDHCYCTGDNWSNEGGAN